MNLVSDTSNIISLLMLAITVSLLANLYFLNKRIIEKTRGSADRKHFPVQLKKHLAEQSERTQNSKFNHAIPTLYKEVIKFRGAYLLIEAKAIDRGIDSKEYWNLINSKIYTLLNILVQFESNPTLKSIEKKIVAIKSLASKFDEAKDTNTINTCLDRFYKACSENSNVARLKKYDEKLNTILDRFSDKDLSILLDIKNANNQFSKRARKEIDNSLINLAEKKIRPEEIAGPKNSNVNKLIRRFDETNEGINQSIETFKENCSSAEAAASSATLSTDDDHLKSNTSQSVLDLLNISEELQSKSENEIFNLKKMVRQQRETIYLLENEIDSNGSSVTNNEPEDSKPSKNKNELEGLRINLRDAENCITILESELTDLKNKIDTATQSLNADGDTVDLSSELVKELESTIKNLEASESKHTQELGFLRVFHDFTKEVVKLSSVEDLAMHTYACIEDLGFSCQILVKGKDREFVVSETGSISTKFKTILNNLALNETNQVNKNTILFSRQDTLSVVVNLKDGTPISNTQATQVLSFIHVANSVIKTLNVADKRDTLHKLLDTRCNHIKKTTHEIDIQLVNLLSALSSTVNTSLKKVQDLARSGGVSASSIARIKVYEQDILDEIEGAKSINIRVKKAFLETLNDLEGMY